MGACYVLLASRPWLKDMASDLEKLTGHTFYTVKNLEELATLNLIKINPRYIFVPHWSWTIPEEIWGNYETVIFHMTDLPFGRGGSPLQNLIVREVSETKLTALRCTAEIDAGAVYLKKDLLLHGTAQEIFERAVPIMQDMIMHIISEKVTPKEQQGTPIFFKRRKPDESNIAGLDSLEKIYDYIRMLDAEGYPHAFLEHKAMRFEFTNAYMENESITAQVRIVLKDENHD